MAKVNRIGTKWGALTRRRGAIKQTERQCLRSFIPQLFNSLPWRAARKLKCNTSGRTTGPWTCREALPCRPPSTALHISPPNLSHYGCTRATPGYQGLWRWLQQDSFISRHFISIPTSMFRSRKTISKTCWGEVNSTGSLMFSCGCCLPLLWLQL